MIENPTPSAAPARNDNVFTVIWQGINTVEDWSSVPPPQVEDAVSFATEVVPSTYGHLTVASITREEWGYMACGEQHDGDNPYDEIDVLFVLEGGHVLVELDEYEPV